MATAPRRSPAGREVDYPTSDGRPMAETDFHRDLMVDLIQTLQDCFAADPDVYVSGNLLLFYEEGNRRKHVSPDVLVTRGIPKLPRRLYYLAWQEGKSPDLVIEITSKTTRREDRDKKWTLYRDVLKVPEYFLFDPFRDYLKPPFQGHRLVAGDYAPIEPEGERLRSEQLGLLLGREGPALRLYDPATGLRLATTLERAAEAEARAAQAQDEVARLRREVEELRRVRNGH